ncbi:Metallo-dependent hydrolase [Xylariaceae sp. FL0594]|nr:Metallo-dependent hydrolase [Xylariaceae sp. FL0594]
MCIQHREGRAGTSSAPTSTEINAQDGLGDAQEPFPWDVGVFDAHCHPTDTMGSITAVSAMKARVLTIMATRAQDQELVSEVASEHGVLHGEALKSPDTSNPNQNRIIPSFGWHPWFSYQLYDDRVSSPTYDGTPEGKKKHYDRILAPAPSSKDASFTEGLCDPQPLSKYLDETRRRLEKFPLALVGEIGIDKAFRLPVHGTSENEQKREEGLTPGGREGRQLSPHRVQVAHQVAILLAQLKLAAEMGRPVSVHGVQAHGVLYETIAECWKGHEKKVLNRRQRRQIAPGAEDFASDNDDTDDDENAAEKRQEKAKQQTDSNNRQRAFPPRICLHSYSGPVEQLRAYIHPTVPANVYFSFSIAINWVNGGKEKIEDVLRAVPDDRVLVESDLHIAGEQMDASLEAVCRKLCHVKGWGLRQGVEILARNWKEFVLG